MVSQKFKDITQAVFRHSLVKGSLYIFVGSMFANFGSYLYHLFVGRILGPRQYGELAALLSLFNILSVPSATLQTILVKYFSGLKAKNKLSQISWLFLSVNKLVFICVFILLLVVLPFLPKITDFLHVSHSEYFFWIYLIFASAVISSVVGSVFQAMQLFKESALLANLGTFLRLIFGVVFAYFGVGWVLISNIFSSILTYLISLLPIRFILKIKPERFKISPRYVFSYSTATFLTNLGIIALYSQDVVLVKHFFSPEIAGIYSALSVLGRVIFFASSAVGFVVFPVIAGYKERNKNYMQLAFIAISMVACASLAITGLYFLWPKVFADLLFGKAFLAVTPYMGLFGIFISFFSISSLIVMMCLAGGRTLVWLLVCLAAVAQICLITIYHGSLFAITFDNIIVSASLFVALLLYFAYDKH